MTTEILPHMVLASRRDLLSRALAGARLLLSRVRRDQVTRLDYISVRESNIRRPARQPSLMSACMVHAQCRSVHPATKNTQGHRLSPPIRRPFIRYTLRFSLFLSLVFPPFFLHFSSFLFPLVPS